MLCVCVVCVCVCVCVQVIERERVAIVCKRQCIDVKYLLLRLHIELKNCGAPTKQNLSSFVR